MNTINTFFKYAKPIVIALFLQIAGLFGPIFGLACFFIKWDKEISTDGSGNFPIIRGDLPKGLRWISTPDERLPGGLYEPAVLAIYNKYGRTFCAYYWMGLRNRVHGLASMCGTETDAGWPDRLPGQLGENRDRGNLWFVRKPFFNNKFSFKAGYRIYNMLDGRWLAVPCFTVTKA